MMKYKVVGLDKKTGWSQWEMPAGNAPVPVEAFIAQMEARGFKHTGFNTNPHHRAELQGQPKFAGVCGPMYDGAGPVIRYETPEAYETLSA